MWVALLTVVLGGAAWAQPEPPADGSSSGALVVEPGRLSPGDALNVSGSGCEPAGELSVQVYAPDLVSQGPVVADRTGAFQVGIVMPTEASVGRAWVRATCQGEQGAPLVFESTVVVVRPALVITGVNVLFGVGLGFVVAGFGIGMRRRPRKRHRSRSSSRNSRRRRRRRMRV